MENIIFSIIGKYGYIGVFLLMAIENIFPPIPSEVILLFSGFMTSKTSLNSYLIVLIATIGSYCGAMILYLIGYIINKERLKKILEGRMGKILKLKQEDVDKADNWFSKQGNKAVFICRFVPIVRSLISIPAGVSKMNIIRFSCYSLSALLIWNSVLVCLGNILGENWVSVARLLDKYSKLVLSLICIIFILFILIIFYKKKKIKNKKA